MSSSNPPASEPPPVLHWDMWLGPALKRSFKPNRFGIAPGRWSSFRWLWDYAGGMMADWGVHLVDIVLKMIRGLSSQCESCTPESHLPNQEGYRVFAGAQLPSANRP